MIRKHLLPIILLFFSVQLNAQDFKSEDELKEKAQELFEEKKFKEASPLYGQLLSLYPKDPNYNYKYGACLLSSSSDREKPLKYLKFAASKGSQVEPLAFYYLGRAHHLNYNFADAVRLYSRFKTKASSSEKEEYDVERQIEMCKNGNQLLSKLNDVQVIEKQTIGKSDFFRIYDLKGIDGKIVAKPEDFKTKYDKKVGEKSVMYLPNNASEVYFSSYGKKGDNGKDIFKTVMLGNRSWSEPVNLGTSINTPYDEDFPFIHPDGRSLYFASKGHNSMGGYDLFMSVFDQATASWKAPINLDFAFSSVDDDVLFVTDKDRVLAYFASTRSNEEDEITVYKVMVDKAPADISVIKGKYIAENNPKPNKAKITIIDPKTKETVGVYETDENGNYQIELATNGGTYQFNLETTEDAPIHTGQVDIPRQDDFEVLGQELRLVGTGEQQQLVIKNIFDGSIAANSTPNGPQISSELLKLKAQLDVNLSAEALAQLSTKKQDDVVSNQSTSKPSVSKLDKNSLEGKLIDVTSLYEANSGNLSNAENIAFNEALQAKQESEKKFDEVGKLKASNANSDVIERAERTAEELAAKAAIATLIAENIIEENDRSGISSRSFNAQSLEIEKKIENGQLENASSSIKTLESEIKASPNANTFIRNQSSDLEKRIASNSSNQKEYQSKTKELQSEKQILSVKLEELESKKSSAKDEQKTQLQSEIDELNLDLNDIDFRLTEATKNYQKSLDVENALNQEKDLYASIENKLNTENRASTVSTISTAERENLISDLKELRSENKLAYFNTMNDEEAQENLNLELGTNDNSLASIEEEYNKKLQEASNMSDVRNSTAKKINLYDNLISDLEVARNKRIENKDRSSNESEKQGLEREIASFDLAIRENQKKKENLEEQMILASSQTNSADDNNLAEQDSPQSSIESSTVSQDNSSQKTANDIASTVVIENIDDVKDNSPIPNNLEEFNFNNDYNYLGNTTKPELLKTKQTLYAASVAATKAEEARSSVYVLPTVEERQKAFADANQYEKESKQLQIKAMEDFGEVNSIEFERNAQVITNANDYGENVESNNLDIALLLNDEAESYFNQAREFRKAATIENSEFKKEIDLQKAYDFEMLALSKQKEALKSLNLVEDDIAINETSKSINKYASVQTIVDPEVLSISNAGIAKAKGDSISLYANDLDSSANQLKRSAQVLEVGAERDSITALYLLKEDSSISLKTKAALYYEREAQIRSGFTPTASISSGIIKPALVSTNAIRIDTVNLNEEEQATIASSVEYLNYRNLAVEKEKIIKVAQSEYDLAIEFREEQYQLQKEADVILQSAANTNDPSEKERRVKQAQIIELKANKLEKSIDSLNRILKVKKYAITEADQKMNNAISGLPESQQAKIVYLTSKQIEENVLVSDGSEQLAEEIEVTVPVSNSSAVGKPANEQDVDRVMDNRVVVKETEREARDEEVLSDGTVNPDNIIRSTNSNTSTSIENNDFEPIKEDVSFVTLGLNESAYDVSNPIPETTGLPDGVVYKVQVGAFRNPIPQDLFKGFAPLSYEEASNGIKRYTAGLFYNENEALSARNAIREIGYSDAFVVAFNNGDRVSVASSRDIAKSPNSPNKVVRDNNNSNSIINSKLSSSFNSEEVEKVKAVGEIDKVYFTVQIGVFSKPVKKGALNNLSDLTVLELSNGLIRYNSGIYNSAEDANNAKELINEEIADAFVTAYYKGRKVTLSEAARIQNQ